MLERMGQICKLFKDLDTAQTFTMLLTCSPMTAFPPPMKPRKTASKCGDRHHIPRGRGCLIPSDASSQPLPCPMQSEAYISSWLSSTQRTINARGGGDGSADLHPIPHLQQLLPKMPFRRTSSLIMNQYHPLRTAVRGHSEHPNCTNRI